MRAFEFLTEAKGIFGRKIGDPFISDNGVTATFQGADIFPDTKTGSAYATVDDMQLAVNDYQNTNGVIDWVNKPNPKTRAFAIAKLDTEDGTPIYWGRWYTTVPASLVGTWANSETPAGWMFNSKTAKKARSGLTPQDLIKTQDYFKGAESVIETIRANGASPEIIEGLRMAALGNTPVFKNQAENLAAIRDHLGEIIVPLALLGGGKIVGGDAESARTKILDAEWNECTVNWPQNKNHNLIDSNFYSATSSLGISNKGNRGAFASVSNIYAAVQKASEQMKNTHKSAIDIINTIQTQNAKEGPIVLAQQFGIIDEYLAREIRENLKVVSTDTNRLSDNAKKHFALYGSVPASSGFSVGLVLLNNCAKAVAAKLNEDSQFQKSCMAFLNQASIIQVYMSARAVGNDVEITNMNCVYPPKFTGGVRIDAGKNYTSTTTKGKLSFDIGKGEDTREVTPTEVEPESKYAEPVPVDLSTGKLSDQYSTPDTGIPSPTGRSERG
jgi:hypothetical protein